MWFYVSIWVLQIGSIALFQISSRKRTRQIRKVARDLFEAHSLMLKAHYILLDQDGFDARFTAQQLLEHLQDKWAEYGITENGFRKMAKEVQQHGDTTA